MKMVSWRGLGEVLGALVVPLGLKMGQDSIFCDFVRLFHEFRAPFWEAFVSPGSVWELIWEL